MKNATKNVRGFFPQSEREYLETRRVGDVTTIRVGYENTYDVVYEGVMDDGRESFIMQAKPDLGDKVLSWRSNLNYLSFYSDLPEGHGKRSIDIGHLHQHLAIYDKNTPEYHEAVAKLIRAGLWEDRN